MEDRESVLAVSIIMTSEKDFESLHEIEQFALTEASYLTVRMVQKFARIEARDPRPWTELYTMVVYSKYGTLVSLTPA